MCLVFFGRLLSAASSSLSPFIKRNVKCHKRRGRERARDDGEVDGARLLLSIAVVAAFAVRAAGQTACMREGEKRESKSQSTVVLLLIPVHA